ncbi:interleukin-34 [Hyla sarda]|uniref:interleukin-34 n=1 Tax=Hyla sarda TaxID=327740 RepID=UPI0024C383BD|nr:interleukin-34 [Hyla sarda]XP_056381399.1 interleukin-34 [Hyla sarda]XP_056381400.1 interleukin-34 [Hyla sarda]XP_056381401.1 interleukin-34 [Hyla sarda]
MTVQRGVLFFLWVLVLARAAVIQEECRIIELISRKLLLENRITYMRDYFPIDYQLSVKYEEIFQCQNITSLINEGIMVDELRFLWGIISENVLQSIWRVLPPRHPSHSFISDLKNIFNALHIGAQPELSDITKDILRRLWTPGNKVKRVTPKNLLDDCVRVLDLLYQEECDLCLPRSAPEEALCPNGTVTGLSAVHRRTC